MLKSEAQNIEKKGKTTFLKKFKCPLNEEKRNTYIKLK